MILTGSEIKKHHELGNIIISDWNENNIGPNSYDLHLGDTFMRPYSRELDMRNRQEERFTKFKIENKEEGLLLHKGDFILAQTLERTETHNLVPMIVGRSSTARSGLFVHLTAGFGDIGFTGYWTLELYAAYNVRIYPGQKICQIYYNTISGDPEIEYTGKYQNNDTVQESRSYIDFLKTDAKES